MMDILESRGYRVYRVWGSGLRSPELAGLSTFLVLQLIKEGTGCREDFGIKP